MGNLIVLMITAFIDMVGLLMLIPILPFYAKELGGGGLIVGLLVSSFAIAQLLSAPFWGRFSDRYGRRPALLVGLSASALAYLIFAFSDHLWLLFLSRLVQGAGGGTVGVIQAYVTDTLEPKQRARGLGWLSAATNAGVALGPVLGSFASTMGRAWPGLLAAGLCLVNIAFASTFLRESRTADDGEDGEPKRGRSLEALTQVVTHSGEPASRLIWIYAIAMGAFNGVTSMLALFLAVRFGLTRETIGFVFMYIGIISVVTRAGVLGWAVDKWGEVKLSRLGIVLLAAGIIMLPFMQPLQAAVGIGSRIGGHLSGSFVELLPYLSLAIPIGLIPLGTAFTFPCVTSLLSRVVSPRERGLYMGVQQTFGGSARVLFPIIAGVAFDRHVQLPFIGSAVLVLATLILGRGLEARIAHAEAPPPAVPVTS